MKPFPIRDGLSARALAATHSFDLYFGSFTIVQIAIALCAWFFSGTSLFTAGMLLTYTALNMVYSIYSNRRPRQKLKLEVFRIFFTTCVMAPTLFVLSEGPMASWWAAFIICSISGTFFLSLYPKSRGYRAPFVGLVILSYFLTTILSIAQPDWYQFAMRASILGMIAGVLASILDVLNRSIEREKLYAGKLRGTIHELSDTQSLLLQSSKLAALGEMAGGVAHEINNPVTIIQLWMNQIEFLLQEPELDRKKITEAIAIVNKTTIRISKIVTGLRSFARDSSKDPVQRVSMLQIIDDTMGLCQERYRTGGIELSFARPADSSSFAIDCHGTELSQVILNLLNNAYDAVEALPERWVRIDVRSSDDRIEVLVTDSGPGIAPEAREKIMLPFFTTKEIGKGTGLGLSISRNIVQSHGGKLELDTECANTRFRITLPRPCAALKAA